MAKGGETLTRGLYTAASGMLALQVGMDACANNLANVSTVGYKRDRTVYHDFEDMLIVRMYDRPDAPSDPLPRMLPLVGRLGTGVYPEDVVTAFDAQGPLELTERPLDIALQGAGYLVVQTPTGERYTRAGQIERAPDGQLQNLNGHPFMGENGPVYLPRDATDKDISITQDGAIYAKGVLVDRLRLVSLPKTAVKSGYTLVDAKGPVTEWAAGTKVEQGYLEQSTVNGVRETVELIEIQRAYEAGAKMIQASDETLGRLFEEVAR